jgi:uncharacterized protein (TIGR01777 family)
MKKILIAGGTGFLGQSLEAYFQQRGDQVTILTRNPRANNHRYWNGEDLGEWTTEVEETDVVINLTGKSVDCRYTEANRAEILRSRVASTRVLGQAIAAADRPPAVWLNASSATIYVHADQQRMTEADGIVGDDFSMSVCQAWEKMLFDFDLPKTRQVALRTSIALGKGGGAFPKMKTITRLGLGGRQGSGEQWMSWIHITDFCRAVAHIIHHEDIKGLVNVTAPCPMRNRVFMRHLRAALNVPLGIPQPVALLELGAWLMRTETELLLKSRNVYPERLLNSGFEFQFGSAEEAIRNLV